MPIGATVHATGMMGRGPSGYVIRADNGGALSIGHLRRAGRWLGRHVEVEGRRCAFDEIIVDRIRATGDTKFSVILPDPGTVNIAAMILYGLFACLQGLFR